MKTYSCNPYAVFSFKGEQIRMPEHQFRQALAIARICKCGDCLCCRALEYQRDAEDAK